MGINAGVRVLLLQDPHPSGRGPSGPIHRAGALLQSPRSMDGSRGRGWGWGWGWVEGRLEGGGGAKKEIKREERRRAARRIFFSMCM